MSLDTFIAFSEKIKKELPNIYINCDKTDTLWQHKISVKKNKNVSDNVNTNRNAIAHNCLNSYIALKYIQYIIDNNVEITDYDKGVIVYTLKHIEDKFIN